MLRRPMFLAILIVVPLAVVLPVAAQDFEKGLEAYKSFNYAAALLEWRPLAEQGNAEAQHKLGKMYEYGWEKRAKSGIQTARPWQHGF